MKGKIIVIEGGDGSGKETQSKHLEKALNDFGIPAKRISFPNYDECSSIPVKAFLHNEFGDQNTLTPEEIAMLFAFDRSVSWHRNHIDELLNDGTNIICDRFTESNLIYQMARTSSRYDEMILQLKIRELENRILGIPMADMVIYLHTDWETSSKLIENRGEEKDANEVQDNYMKKVREIGLQMAEHHNWSIVNCCPTPGEILQVETIANIVFGLALAKIDTRYKGAKKINNTSVVLNKEESKDE